MSHSQLLHRPGSCVRARQAPLTDTHAVWQDLHYVPPSPVTTRRSALHPALGRIRRQLTTNLCASTQLDVRNVQPAPTSFG
jgi:hypothetical protein